MKNRTETKTPNPNKSEKKPKISKVKKFGAVAAMSLVAIAPNSGKAEAVKTEASSVVYENPAPEKSKAIGKIASEPKAKEFKMTLEMAQEAEMVRESLTAFMTDLADEARGIGGGASAIPNKFGDITEKLAVNGYDTDELYIRLQNDQDGNLLRYGFNKTDKTSGATTEYWVGPSGFGIDVTTDNGTQSVRSQSYNLHEGVLIYRDLGVDQDGQPVTGPEAEYPATMEYFGQAIDEFQNQLGTQLVDSGVRTI